MNKSLDAFIRQLKDFRKHINLLKEASDTYDLIQQKDDILDEYKNKIQKVLQKDTNEKLIEYNSNVITLYGYWEQFVENIINEYVTEINSISISAEIKHEDYRKQIFNLFNRIEKSNPKFKNIKEEDIIESLYSVVINKQNKYIAQAFYQSGGNYNFEEIAKCFKSIGISDFESKLKLYPSMKSYFKKENNSDYRSANLFAKLDYFVSLRNEVAHGGGQNMISPDEFIPYVEFFESMSNGINEYIEDKFNELKWKSIGNDEIKVSHFYDKIEISELEKKTFKIDTTKSLMYKKETSSYPKYAFAKIISIKINNEIFGGKLLTVNSDQKVTLKFTEPLKRNYVIKFLNS